MVVTRGQLLDLIVERAGDDSRYYDALMTDARSLISRELGIAIPSSITIKVLKERPDTYYIILPCRRTEDSELSDSDLERVSGGIFDKGCTGNVLSTHVAAG